MNRRDLFDKYYVPLILIKDFNVLIDNKPFFDQPVKNKQVCKQFVEMSRNDDYTAGNLLDYCTIKIIINSLVLIYQDKKIQVFLNKLI